MKFTRLIIRNILRSKTRSLLTLTGISVSIFIFAALLSLDRGVAQMIEASGGEDTLVVFDRFAGCPPYSQLPVHYAEKIADLPHVAAVMPVRFLLSNCGTTTDLIALHGVEPDKLRRFREIEIPTEQYTQFEAERGAGLVGRLAAEKYGWEVGQQVSLPQLRGISFTVRGIFDAPGSSLQQVILVSREYLERSIEEPGIATLFMVQVDDPGQLAAVGAAIDAQFANFDRQTRSGPERGFIAAQIASFRELVHFAQLVAYAALALLLLAVINAVSMSVRDRRREMALLKLLGFDSTRVTQLVVSETAILGVLASAAGVALTAALFNLGSFGISVEGFTLHPHLSRDLALTALAAGLGLSLLGAWWPTRDAARAPIVLALKGVD